MAEKLEPRSELFTCKDVTNPDNATPGFHLSNNTTSGVSVMLTVESQGDMAILMKYFQFDLQLGKFRGKQNDGKWTNWTNLT